MPSGRTEEKLAGLTVAVTGRFVTMTHVEAAELIRECGGRFLHTPSRKTDLLVVGEDGWPLTKEGQPTENLRKARRFQAQGLAVEILSEDDFLNRLELTDQKSRVLGQHTLVQLSRTLDLPRAALRRWIRLGLIQPIETHHRLEYFNYKQVARAKMLVQLVEDGVALDAIGQSLEQLRTWIPDLDTSLGQLISMESDGGLLVRFQGGTLAEPSGQLRFDFSDGSSADDPQSVSTATPSDPVDPLVAATYFEERGDLRGAALNYREAAEFNPDDPVLQFNAGNIFSALHDTELAIRFLRRATDLDPKYVEAWNNLGSVLSDLGDGRAAITAFERALEIMPDYADAHYNLGDVRFRLGDTAGATRHWEAYLEFDAASAWARYVRNRIRKIQAGSGG